MNRRRVYSLRYHDLKKAATLLAALLALVAFSVRTPSPHPEIEAAPSLTVSEREAASPTPVVLPSPQITSPQPGDTFDTGQLTIAGTGSPGLSVRLFERDVTRDRPLGTASVEADGQWSLALSEPLGEGDHQLTAVTVDATGQASVASPPLTVAVTLPPLSSPVILRPRQGQILHEGRPTLTGTAVPGGTVRLLRDDQLLGSVEVPADGNWSFTVSKPLPEGLHTLTALSEDAAGRISESSKAIVVNVIPPALTAPAMLALDVEETIQGQELPLLGTASPGATVWVFSGEQVLGITKAGDDGRWTFRLPTTLAEGTYRLRAAVVDDDGRTSPLSSPVTLRVLPRIMATPAIISPSAGVTLMQGRLSLSGVAQPGSTVEVRDGQTPLGTTQAGPDGRWTFWVSQPLGIGEHQLTAMARDDRGRISSPSPPVLAHVSAPPPPPTPIPTPTPAPIPALTPPTIAEVLAGESVTVTGTTLPGATVAVYDGAPSDGDPSDGAVLLGSIQAGTDGVWSLVLGKPLTEGQHHLSAIAADETGRTSQPSETVVVEIMPLPPLLPVTGGDRLEIGD